ncbi:MAG: tetratricopeptide repeat protein [Gammaproteobacteria bacterium]|nr:tetratricopeptide repeat protein [Gammaproteobacteria bacterium]
MDVVKGSLLGSLALSIVSINLAQANLIKSDPSGPANNALQPLMMETKSDDQSLASPNNQRRVSKDQPSLIRLAGGPLDPMAGVTLSRLEIDTRAHPREKINAPSALEQGGKPSKAAKLVDGDKQKDVVVATDALSVKPTEAPEKSAQVDAVLKSLSQDKLSAPVTANVLVESNTGVKKANTNERLTPAVAEIPEKRERTPLSVQAAKFSELKRGLQSPGGLSYLPDLQAFVKQYPEHNLARLWLVKSQIEAGHLSAAADTIGKPGQWRESDWQVGFWKARVLLLLGDSDSARMTMERALTQGSESADLWVQQAVLEQEANNHSVAVQLLRIALEVDPDHAHAQLNLGYSLEHLAKPADALKAYQQYIANSRAGFSSMRLDVLKRIELLANFAAGIAQEQLAEDKAVKTAGTEPSQAD